MKFTRRRFLALFGFMGIALGAAAYHQGLRFPPPQFVPDTAPTRSSSSGDDTQSALVSARGAIYQQRERGIFQFRAFVPEPVLQVEANGTEPWRVEIQNIHPNARLIAPGGINEEKDNLLRRVSGSTGSIKLKWKFVDKDSYRFAAIGDTGGGTELEWTLRRSVELGADFYLHLGDFNYQEGDYESAAKIFNEASIPSFVAIGNHDFYRGFESIHTKFTHFIGPRNAGFSIGGIQFVNLDTATTFWPKDAGARGRFISELEADSNASDFVVFTHKPFKDPAEAEEGRNHRINTREGDWLRRELLDRGMKTMLAGHIHIKSEFDDKGLYTYISGQGLAHADYIFGHPVAEILIGDIEPGQAVDYHWEPLNMPYQAHCSERGWEVLDALNKDQDRSKLKKICSE